MLKEKVVSGIRLAKNNKLKEGEMIALVSHSANSAKDSTAHKVISVGAETINDIMVIPDVQLSDAAIGTLERLLAIPANVIIEIIVVALGAQFLAEEEIASLLGIANSGPFSQRTVNSHAIVVDLITATNHDVKGLVAMDAEDIVPKSGTAPSVNIGTNAEAVAGVEHDPHRLRLCGDNKDLGGRASGDWVDSVLPFSFKRLNRDVNGESPEGLCRVLVQFLAGKGA